MRLLDIVHELGLKSFSKRMEDTAYQEYLSAYQKQYHDIKVNEYNVYASYLFQRLTHYLDQFSQKERTGKSDNKPIEYRISPLAENIVYRLQERHYEALRFASFSNLPTESEEKKFNDAMTAPNQNIHVPNVNWSNPWYWRVSQSYIDCRKNKNIPITFRITANVRCTPEWIPQMDAFCQKYRAKYKSPTDCASTNRVDTINVYFATPLTCPTTQIKQDFCDIMRPYIRSENNDRLIGSEIEKGIHWSTEKFSSAQKNKFDYEMDCLLDYIADENKRTVKKTSGRLHFNSRWAPEERSAAQIETLFQIKELLSVVVCEQQTLQKETYKETEAKTETKTNPAKEQKKATRTDEATQIRNQKAYQYLMDALHNPQNTSDELIKLSMHLDIGEKINQPGHPSRSAFPTDDKGQTLLGKAVALEEVEVVANLMKKGADATLINKGKTIFHVATENIYDVQIMDKMLNQLMTSSDSTTMKQLLNQPDANGLTPVTLAILVNEDAVKPLMRYGGTYQSETTLRPYFAKFPQFKKQYDSYMKKNKPSILLTAGKSY